MAFQQRLNETDPHIPKSAISCGACGKIYNQLCQCKLVGYCGRACQKKHWRIHRKVCTWNNLRTPVGKDFTVEIALNDMGGAQVKFQVPRTCALRRVLSKARNAMEPQDYETLHLLYGSINLNDLIEDNPRVFLAALTTDDTLSLTVLKITDADEDGDFIPALVSSTESD